MTSNAEHPRVHLRLVAEERFDFRDDSVEDRVTTARIELITPLDRKTTLGLPLSPDKIVWIDVEVWLNHGKLFVDTEGEGSWSDSFADIINIPPMVVIADRPYELGQTRRIGRRITDARNAQGQAFRQTLSAHATLVGLEPPSEPEGNSAGDNEEQK